jgi:hypothetical protein
MTSMRILKGSMNFWLDGLPQIWLYDASTFKLHFVDVPKEKIESGYVRHAIYSLQAFIKIGSLELYLAEILWDFSNLGKPKDPIARWDGGDDMRINFLTPAIPVHDIENEWGNQDDIDPDSILSKILFFAAMAAVKKMTRGKAAVRPMVRMVTRVNLLEKRTQTPLIATTREDTAHIFRFFDLLRELRNKIYEQPILMDHWLVPTYLEHDIHIEAEKLSMSLLLVNRQFRDEYTERCEDQQALFLHDAFASLEDASILA